MALEEYMLPCPSKKFLGIECLGCGMQRSLSLLIKGELDEAFQMYPPIYCILIMIGLVAINFIDKKRSYGKWIQRAAILTASVMVISYCYKKWIYP